VRMMVPMEKNEGIKMKWNLDILYSSIRSPRLCMDFWCKSIKRRNGDYGKTRIRGNMLCGRAPPLLLFIYYVYRKCC
jgi:hypothetical protein